MTCIDPELYRLSVRCATVTLLLLAPQALRGQDTRTRTVPDAISCSACTINVRPLVRLGAGDGDGSLSGFPTAVRADSRGRYWVLEWRRPPMLFGTNGRFVRNVGRIGQGPGEFLAPFDVVTVAADSILVIDAAATRATVFSPDLRPRRSVSLRTQLFSSTVVRWPDRVMTNTRAATRAAGWPLHLMSFAGSDIAVVKSFGPDSLPLRPGSMPTHRLAKAGAERLWSADVQQYRLVEWTGNGERLTTLERNPDWFDGKVSGGLGTSTSPPPPAIQALDVDDHGRVWVFVAVAADTWREGWPGGAGARREVRVQDMAYEKLYRTTVEVIDPTEGRVVARRTIDRWVIAALPGRRIAAYNVDQDGIPRVEISQIELTGATTRSK